MGQVSEKLKKHRAGRDGERGAVAQKFKP